MKNKKHPTYIEHNEQLITDRRHMCSIFNSFFTNVAANLNNVKYADSPPPLDGFQKFLKCRSQNSMMLYEICPEEIVKIISSFKNKKSSDLSVIALKHVKYQLAPTLSVLLNDCMFAGVFPHELKAAKVIPLFKSGKPELISNYRPISLLPIFSKIFEKLLHSRLSGFLDKMNILYNKQFGFRKQHSTVHALQTATSSVLQSMNSRSQSIGLFLDFSKAFDTLNHSILLKKLEHYGFRGVVLNLLTDYLSNRYQYVELDGQKSDFLPITFGVPQGSVLGSLLFI